LAASSLSNSESSLASLSSLPFAAFFPAFYYGLPFLVSAFNKTTSSDSSSDASTFFTCFLFNFPASDYGATFFAPFSDIFCFFVT